MVAIDGTDDNESRCAWCSAIAARAATHCPACGAALARRQTIGDLVIPGVTHVDPGLEQYARQPLRIPGASPSQSVAGSMMGAAAAAGGVGAVAGLIGLAAVAATEYRGASRGAPTSGQPLEKVGQPSEAVLKMLEQLKEQERAAGLSSAEGPPLPVEGSS
jgi:hypothetical protein